MARQTLSDAGVSEREAEVLALLAERATNAEIAAHLYVSVRTVESHVSSLLRKLGASDRRQLADLATGLGVTVLATSRARLMLPFEWVFQVPPMVESS